MKAKSMAALSALCVAAVLGAGMGVMAFGNANSTVSQTGDQTIDLTTNETANQTYPLLTIEQLADLRTMAGEPRAIGMDGDLANQLVDVQFEQYVAENLATYGLSEDEISAVMAMFNAIDDKMAEIKEVAYEMRENGSTVDEIFAVVDPMLGELQTLQDQLRTTLEGYGISMCPFAPPYEAQPGPGGPEHHHMNSDTSSPLSFSF